MFADEKKVVVITSVSKWDEAPRMRHYVAKYLSAFYNIIFCELNRSGKSELIKVDEGIIVFKIGLYVRGIYKSRIFSKIFDKLQSILILRMLKKNFSQNNLVLINFKFDFFQIYHNQVFKKKYFFLNDDFVNMNLNDTKKIKLLKEKDLGRVAGSAHRVFTSSDPLAEEMKVFNKKVDVIYSGHDFDSMFDFRTEPSCFIKVCYMGFIHNKLELEWFEAIAERHDMQLTLIGPLESSINIKKLKSMKNVTFIPPMVGRKLQKTMAEHNVFIMPYKQDPVNSKTTVPAKLFQYLACGRPIVTSRMENLIKLPKNFVYFANNKEDFVNKVLVAVNNDNQNIAKDRIDFAMNYTWCKQIKIIREIIESDCIITRQ